MNNFKIEQLEPRFMMDFAGRIFVANAIGQLV